MEQQRRPAICGRTWPAVYQNVNERYADYPGVPTLALIGEALWRGDNALTRLPAYCAQSAKGETRPLIIFYRDADSYSRVT